MGHNHSGLSQVEDGFEWWYFQAVTKDLRLTVVGHVTDLVGR